MSRKKAVFTHQNCIMFQSAVILAYGAGTEKIIVRFLRDRAKASHGDLFGHTRNQKASPTAGRLKNAVSMERKKLPWAKEFDSNDQRKLRYFAVNTVGICSKFLCPYQYPLFLGSQGSCQFNIMHVFLPRDNCKSQFRLFPVAVNIRNHFDRVHDFNRLSARLLLKFSGTDTETF